MVKIGKWEYKSLADADKRYKEIYEKAVSRYLEKTDFDISTWLSDEEYNEFEVLREEL